MPTTATWGAASARAFGRQAKAGAPAGNDVGAGADPAFSSVQLLVHGAAAGVTVYDASSAHHTLTKNNGANGIGTVQKYGSYALDLTNGGTGDAYFTLETRIAIPGDYTLEAWVNWPSAGSALRAPIFVNSDVNNATQLAFFIGSGGQVRATGTVLNYASTAVITRDNLWHHIAVTRQGSTVRGFIDGVLDVTTATDSVNYTPTTGVARVGNDPTAIGTTDGAYLDEVRVTVGVARYVASFPVPSGPFPDVVDATGDIYSQYIALLLHGDGTDGGAAFNDNSQYKFQPYVKGTPTTSATQAKFGPTSIKFNGTTDYLSYQDAPAFNFAANNFTIEAWIYPTASSVTGGMRIVTQYDSTAAAGFYFTLTAANQLQLSFYPPTGVSVVGTTPYTVNTWQHVAAVRDGATLRVYLNGVQVGSVAVSGTQIDAFGPLFIGAVNTGSANAPTAANFFQGYIDDLRITNGVCRYPGGTTFTPPAAAFVNAPGIVEPYSSSVALLLHGDGANNGTVFTDSGALAFAATRVGSPVTSTAQFKYGTASLLFNGTTDYLSFPANVAFQLSGDFTIEAWIYPTALPAGYTYIAGQNTSSGTTSSFTFGVHSSLGPFITVNPSSGATTASGSAPPALNTWHHIAAVRDGNTVRIYIDGVQVGTTTVSGALNTATSIFMVGAANATTPTGYFTGYIDDLRITNGICRYPGGLTFTPPTQAFVNPAPSALWAATGVLHNKVWNPSFTTGAQALMVLSNSNKTALDNNSTISFAMAMAGSALSSGQAYIELTVNSLYTYCNPGMTQDPDPYNYGSGQVFFASGGSSVRPTFYSPNTAFPGYAVNAVLGFAIDYTNKKMWISVNGVYSGGGNPLTGALPHGFFPTVATPTVGIWCGAGGSGGNAQITINSAGPYTYNNGLGGG